MGPTKISLSMILFFIIPLAMAHHPFHHAKGFFHAHAHANDHAHDHAHANDHAHAHDHAHDHGVIAGHAHAHAHDHPVEMSRPSEGLPQVTFAEDLLDAHNRARAEVGVGPLKWDYTVAAYTTSYASQRVGDCNLVHSEGPYGENIAESSADVSAAEYVKMWVDEKQFYDQHSNTCKGGDCLHYTQVVWKNTVSVGCAKVQCKNNGWFFVTCNYNPPGNFIGERPY